MHRGQRPVRIANCSGFFGDRISAAREMVDPGVTADSPIDVLAAPAPPGTGGPCTACGTTPPRTPARIAPLPSSTCITCSESPSFSRDAAALRSAAGKE